MTRHPLLDVLLACAASDFPPADGSVVVLPPLPGGLDAVFCCTGRAYLATAADLSGLPLDGYGTALDPAVLSRLAGTGVVDTVDVTLVAAGRGGGRLPVRHDRDAHPRVRRARSIRADVRVHGDRRGLVTVAAGLAGRTELSVEVEPDRYGHGRDLVTDGLAVVPAGEPVFAAVAPGNARSLRAFLASGFRPIGSEVIVQPNREDQS